MVRIEEGCVYCYRRYLISTFLTGVTMHSWLSHEERWSIAYHVPCSLQIYRPTVKSHFHVVLCGVIAVMTANIAAQVTVKTDYPATKY